MKRTIPFVAASLLVAAIAPAEEATPAPDFDPAAFAALTAPVEQHEQLAKFAGTWSLDQTYHVPGAPPVKSTGTSVNELAMGGRYLVSKVTSDFLGGYAGMGIDAYDKVRKQFVSTWIDSMGTGIMVSYGKQNDDGSIEYVSEPQPDASSGQNMILRMVSKFDSDDQVTFAMFTKPADAGADDEMKIMTIVYTRKK